jgi:hypothetical protein
MNLKLISAADYAALEDKDPETLYIVTDAEADTVDLYLGDKKISDDIIPKTITANGTFDASADGADGYNPVTVNIPIVTKTITENGTYDASSDSAEGYNPVTVNVPQPVITQNSVSPSYADFDPTDPKTQYLDTDEIFKITAPVGTAHTDSVTVDGVTYNGMALSGAATISTNQILGSTYQVLEINMITTALGSGSCRIVSTGGTYFEGTVWTSASDDYLKIVGIGGEIIDTTNIVDLGGKDLHDLSIPKSGLIDTVLTVKYVYDGEYITLYINDVAKVRWYGFELNPYFQAFGVNIGANGASANDMLVVPAEFIGESLSWDGRTWSPA